MISKYIRNHVKKIEIILKYIDFLVCKKNRMFILNHEYYGDQVERFDIETPIRAAKLRIVEISAKRYQQTDKIRFSANCKNATRVWNDCILAHSSDSRLGRNVTLRF